MVVGQANTSGVRDRGGGTCAVAVIRAGHQWSHGFSTMETGKERMSCETGRVSMEPRFFNHGDRGPHFAVRDAGAAFQWSHGFSTMEPKSIHLSVLRNWKVSMEPRFFNHGDPTRHRPNSDAHMVSMEPRFFNHGDLPDGSVIVEQGGVSMEPRFFNHGDLYLRANRRRRRSSFNGATVFQPWRPPSILAHI